LKFVETDLGGILAKVEQDHLALHALVMGKHRLRVKLGNARASMPRWRHVAFVVNNICPRVNFFSNIFVKAQSG